MEAALIVELEPEVAASAAAAVPSANTRTSYAPRGVVAAGPFPPKASGAGYRYYVPSARAVRAPTVIAGWSAVLRYGLAAPVPAPTGFSTYEAAANAAILLFPGITERVTTLY